MDVKIVDIGAETRITCRPGRDEALPFDDQHCVGRRHRGELAAPVRAPFAVECRAKRAVLQDATIGGTPACNMEGRDGIGVGDGRRADRHYRFRGLRSMGVITGELPAWMVPSTSKPWRSYNGTFLRLEDSR